MKKKIMIVLLTIILIVGVTAGVIYLVKNKSEKSNPVKVVSVMTISGGMYSDGRYSGNLIGNDCQKLYADNDTVIKEVYVTQGQTVKRGDPLLMYDKTAENLKLNTKKAEYNLAKANIAVAEKELKKLKNTKPVEEIPTEEPTEPVTEEPTENPAATSTDAPKEEGVVAKPADIEPPASDDPSDNGEIQYTKEELAEAIKAKEAEIDEMKFQLKQQQLDIDKQAKLLSDGVVYSRLDGEIETLDISDENIAAGGEIISVKGEKFYSMILTVDETSYSKFIIGQPMNMMSYDTGGQYKGIISKVSTIPAETYGDDSTSYYSVTVDVINGEDLMEGAWIEASFEQINFDGTSDSLILSRAFVREENGKFYVFKDDNGSLKKQYIKAGKIYYGSEIEILGGVTADDYIAFPYSKDAVEGRKTKIVTVDEMY